MTAMNSRHLVTLVGVFCLLSVIATSLLWLYGRQSLEISFAEEQTAIFEEMRSKAVQGSPTTAAECLQYVVAYYPTGSKQQTGSKLDRMVERARARALAEIVAHLRRSTGEDLGEAPEPWIAKYNR